MGIPPENLNNKHTNMKKIMIFSAIFAVAISLSACSNNETDISYASAETITLSSTTLNFENAGGTQTAEVESTHEFAAYSNDSWIKVTPTNPVGKKATITVTVGELDSKEVPIQCEIVGSVADGYMAGELTLDPEVLLLRGQRDDLLNVSYAKVRLDITNALRREMIEIFSGANVFQEVKG